jgi:hypothetical protein
MLITMPAQNGGGVAAAGLAEPRGRFELMRNFVNEPEDLTGG